MTNIGNNFAASEESPFGIVFFHGNKLEAMIFLAFYVIILIFQVFINVKGYRSRDMRNRFHITISVVILLLILSRLVVLISSLIILDIKLTSAFWEVYMSFNLPFDLLNIAIETNFFQWMEVSHTLNHLVWLNARKAEKEALLHEDSLDSQILDNTEAEDSCLRNQSKIEKSSISSSSESSWTSQEMAELHEQKSVKQGYLMIFSVLITVLLDIYYLVAAVFLDTHP